jgi:hypothetical protein
MKSLGIALVFALGLSGAAAAAQAPSSDPSVHAVSWRCEGEQCGGGGPNAPSDAALQRECAKVVSVVGPVSRYVSRGRELSAHGLEQCNRRATRAPVGGG